MEQLGQAEQRCLEDGYLKPAFGGLPRITKKGQEFVRLSAITDDEIAEALKDALSTGLLERRAALASVMSLAYLRGAGTP